MGATQSVDLPVGVVTLLFSDIEGSTRLLRALGEVYEEVLGDHHRLLRNASSSTAVWRSTPMAMRSWSRSRIRVRRSRRQSPVSARCGQTLGREGASCGCGWRAHRFAAGARRGLWAVDVHYAARLCAAASGGQVLLSESTAALVDFALEDLGKHAVKDFPSARRIFHVPIDGLGSDCFPPPRTLATGRTNLPNQLSSFVGRERELRELRALLAGSRVVTLTGPGGVGKTRLAIRLGAELLDGSGAGVWFVDLAPLLESALVAGTVAAVLGVSEQPGARLLDALADALVDRRLLLVLDNCEHVVENAAELVAGLVRRCPGVSVLATSREPLRIAGEHVYRVPSLSVPEELADPVRLARSKRCSCSSSGLPSSAAVLR